jgi:hypothetical protein
MIGPDGRLLAEGWDIAEFSNDGRISKVVTFWGALPALPADWPHELVWASTDGT